MMRMLWWRPSGVEERAEVVLVFLWLCLVMAAWPLPLILLLGLAMFGVFVAVDGTLRRW